MSYIINALRQEGAVVDHVAEARHRGRTLDIMGIGRYPNDLSHGLIEVRGRQCEVFHDRLVQEDFYAMRGWSCRLPRGRPDYHGGP